LFNNAKFAKLIDYVCNIQAKKEKEKKDARVFKKKQDQSGQKDCPAPAPEEKN